MPDLNANSGFPATKTKCRRVISMIGKAGMAFVILMAGVFFGKVWGHYENMAALERTIAIMWGDGKYGPAFYGAHVYMIPQNNDFSVRARVMIGEAGYWHDCGELGRAESRPEAVAKWGTINWRADGLRIGAGENEHFTPRQRIESHR